MGDNDIGAAVAVVPSAEANNKTTENGTSGDETMSNENNNETTGSGTGNADGDTANASAENGSAADSNKKPKKVKKRLSFRLFSFSKKDKQKPSKKDDAAKNGECEKVPEEVYLIKFIYNI